MYRCVFDLEQHRADDQRMTSKYRESDSKACGAVIIYRSEGAVCSRGALMSYNDRSACAALDDVIYV